MEKFPDQKKPFAVQLRTSFPTPNTREKRHHWMATARCAWRTPLGALVVPDEKNSAPASDGFTAPALASTSASGVALPCRRKSGQASTAPPTLRSGAVST